MAAAEGGARSPRQRERLLFVWEAAAVEVGRELAPAPAPAPCPPGCRRPARFSPAGGAPPAGLALRRCPAARPARGVPQPGCPAAWEPPRAAGSSLGRGSAEIPSASSPSGSGRPSDCWQLLGTPARCAGRAGVW